MVNFDVASTLIFAGNEKIHQFFNQFFKEIEKGREEDKKRAERTAEVSKVIFDYYEKLAEE